MTMSRWVSLLVAASVIPASLAAQEITPPPIEVPAPDLADEERRGPALTIGLGAGVAPDYEGSDDYGLVPLWNLRAANLYHPDTFIQVTGPTLRSNLLADDHWRLGVSGRYLRDYDDVDDDAVSDLNDVDDTLLFGVTAGYDLASSTARDLAAEVDLHYDALEGNGGLVTPRLRFKDALSESVIVDLSASAAWASEDYMDNRFGIDSGDAADSGLDEHDADPGFKNATLTGSLTFRLTEALSLTGLAAYTRLLDDAEDSPIVDDRGSPNQALGALLVNYTF
jgi:MipA family protein